MDDTGEPSISIAMHCALTKLLIANATTDRQIACEIHETIGGNTEWTQNSNR